MVTQNAQYASSGALPFQSDWRRRSRTSRSDAIIDAELVRRFNTGDETAFLTIMLRYRERLYLVAFGVLRNCADAEEIAQDTFVSAHRGLGGFRGDSSLSTWLYRIALNLSRNRYWYFHRRCRHASVSLDSPVGGESEMTFSDVVTTDAVGPAREVVIGEFSDLVARCMLRLDAPQREILAMRVTQRRSYAEIAQQLGISIGTVKSRIARARDSLRTLMSETCPEFRSAVRHVEWFGPVRPKGGILAACS